MFEKNVENFFLEVARWISPIIVIFIFEKIIFLFFAFVWHNFTEQNNYLHFSQT